MPDRTLIRASLTEIRDADKPQRKLRPVAAAAPAPAPSAGQTNAENFYYLKQINSRTPMVFVLRDGDTVEGIIEWYDKTCLRVLRTDAPAVLLYKEAIRYMYKAEQTEPHLAQNGQGS